jgi:hypothetical protein
VLKYADRNASCIGDCSQGCTLHTLSRDNFHRRSRELGTSFFLINYFRH